MKKLYILFFTILSFQLVAQEKYYTKSGTILFESSVPTFEEVKATNTKVTAILKDDGTIASLALTKAFRFKVALMEEHFNENYIESSTYPKAKFSGKIANFSISNLSEKATKHSIIGKLILHGVAKEIKVVCAIKMIDNVITITSNFNVTPEDFNIQIPKIVRKKIAKQVAVSLVFELQKK